MGNLQKMVMVVEGMRRGSLAVSSRCGAMQPKDHMNLQANETRAPNEHINIRILATMMSGIPLI